MLACLVQRASPIVSQGLRVLSSLDKFQSRLCLNRRLQRKFVCWSRSRCYSKALRCSQNPGALTMPRLVTTTSVCQASLQTLEVQQDGATREDSSATIASQGANGTPTKDAVKPEVVPAHQGIQATAADLPLPVLGYACLNCTLRHQKPTLFNNRTCRLATIKDPEKGLPFVSGLALQNCRDLLPILQWNVAHDIKLMRLSSEFFPWGNVHYKICELPDYEEIKAALAEAGEYARKHNHRLTTHPSEFVKLAGQTEKLVNDSIADLELHSEMFDLLGYDATIWKHWNKINIHVGGTYGDKDAALRRFADNYKRLSPSCQLRLTVENDDRASMFSVADLMVLHEMTGYKLPIVFDFHHYRFCTGGQSPEEALRMAISTWPPGVRPVVHWSESQGGKKEHAHSDYIGQTGRMDLYGLDADIDVMIESKAKELSLLLYRDIVEHGNSGRDDYFLSIDVIEEEAARVEALKKAGETVELEPVVGVKLEGVEIIPCNDKRLHGRSQRRNKPQRKAAAAAAKAAEDSADDTAAADGTETPAKPKRKRATKAKGKAAAQASEADGDGQPASGDATQAVQGDPESSQAAKDAPKPKRKRAPSKAAQAKAAAALAEAEAAAAGGDAAAVPSAREAEAAVAADGPAAKPARSAKATTASAKRKKTAPTAVKGNASSLPNPEAEVNGSSATPLAEGLEASQDVDRPTEGGADNAAPSKGSEGRGSATSRPKARRGPSKTTKAKAAAALADAEAAAGATLAPSSDKALSPVHEDVVADDATANNTARPSESATTGGQPAAKRRRGRSAAAVQEAEPTPPPLGDAPTISPTELEKVVLGSDAAAEANGSGKPAKTSSSSKRATRAVKASAAVAEDAATAAAERGSRRR